LKPALNVNTAQQHRPWPQMKLLSSIVLVLARHQQLTMTVEDVRFLVDRVGKASEACLGSSPGGVVNVEIIGTIVNRLFAAALLMTTPPLPSPLISTVWRVVMKLVTSFNSVRWHDYVDIVEVIHGTVALVSKHLPPSQPDDAMPPRVMTKSQSTWFRFYASHLTSLVRSFPDMLKSSVTAKLFVGLSVDGCDRFSSTIAAADHGAAQDPQDLLKPCKNTILQLLQLLFKMPEIPESFREVFWRDLVDVVSMSADHPNRTIARHEVVEHLLVIVYAMPQSFQRQFHAQKMVTDYFSLLDGMDERYFVEHGKVLAKLREECVQSLMNLAHQLPPPTQVRAFLHLLMEQLVVLRCDWVVDIVVDIWVMIHHDGEMTDEYFFKQLKELIEIMVIMGSSSSAVVSERFRHLILTWLDARPLTANESKKLLGILEQHPHPELVQRWFPYSVLMPALTPAAVKLGASVEQLIEACRLLGPSSKHLSFPLACMYNMVSECHGQFHIHYETTTKSVLTYLTQLLHHAQTKPERDRLASTKALHLFGHCLPRATLEQAKQVIDFVALTDMRQPAVGMLLIHTTRLPPNVASQRPFELSLKRALDTMFNQSFRSVGSSDDWLYQCWSCCVAYVLSTLSEHLDLQALFSQWVSERWVRYAARETLADPDDEVLSKRLPSNISANTVTLAELKVRLDGGDGNAVVTTQMDVDKPVTVDDVLTQIEILASQMQIMSPSVHYLSFVQRRTIQQRLEKVMKMLV
jgi:hypothetical protein